MRFFLVFAVFLCIFSHTRAKPLRVHDDQDRDTGEVEYENDDEREAYDYAQDNQDAQTDDQRGRINGQRDAILDNRGLELNSYNHQASDSQPVGLLNLDNFSELSKSSRDARNDKLPNANVNSDPRPILKYRQTDEYTQKNEQESSHLSNNGFSINRGPSSGYDNNSNKRTMLSLNANEEGDFLFKNHKEQDNKLDRSEYEGDNSDSNIQTRYSKQFYNIPVGNTDLTQYKNYQKRRFNINRDRRQVQKANDQETNELTLPPEDNENEETAIKRHIKKLSEQELEELFNSLSEDKRNLLKKILENDYDNDNENKNKREITKKAGAVEENFIENGQLDSNKNQGLSSNVVDINTESSVSQETNLDNNKRTMSTVEIEDVVVSKNTGADENPENTAELKNRNEDVVELKSENNLNLDSKKSEVDLMSNSQIETNSENKRAANVSDLTNGIKTSNDAKSTGNHFNPKENKGSENNQEFFSNNGDISEFINKETERYSPHKNNLKREIYLDESSNFSDSLKPLEESFPNSKVYGESNSFLEAEMAPLVRVKRRNAESAMVKREANIKADTNVPYFPNKGENDDEDNEEGSEFDDDGFYDRTSNYARNNVNKPFKFNCPNAGDNNLKLKSGRYDDNENNILSSDTMSLGSDTDNVMTGVEGVNDNLMYSSGARNRRALDEVGSNNYSIDEPNDLTNERYLRSTPLQDNEARTMSDVNTLNIPGFQVNDAFGPLPRNYDGDLERYKRVRRVKQIPIIQEKAY